MAEELFWFRCPEGHLGKVDLEQKEGKVSIICTCGWHGFVWEGKLEEPQTKTER